MKKKYQSKILESIHEVAQDLHRIGAINDIVMKEFDDDCLVPAKPKKAMKIASSTSVSKSPAPIYASPK